MKSKLHRSKLARVFHFSEDDLRDNRHGRISPRQSHRLVGECLVQYQDGKFE